MKVIKVMGNSYQLIVEGKCDDIGAFGKCQVREQVIRIASDLHPDGQASTLLHEIIEAVNYYLDLKLEHEIIMRLESGLYCVLADNGIDLGSLFRDEQTSDSGTKDD